MRILRILSCSTLLITLLPIASHAQSEQEITLVNHFNQTMNFTVGINPDVVPDLPQKFSLNNNEQIKTKVLDNQKQAYIRGEDANKENAFFGVNIQDNTVQIHGYISKGIAFSWNAQTITFCTPEEYKKNHSC